MYVNSFLNMGFGDLNVSGYNTMIMQVTQSERDFSEKQYISARM